MKKLINMVLVVLFSFSDGAFANEINVNVDLARLEMQNSQLMSMKAAGDCTTTCSKNYYYPYDTVCRSSCDNGSSSYGGGKTCGGQSFVVGCLIGVLVGSFGDPVGPSMGAGCAVVGGIFYAISPPCD